MALPAEYQAMFLAIVHDVVNCTQIMFSAARIDHGHHAGKAARALNEAVALAKAVEKAVGMVDKGKVTMVLLLPIILRAKLVLIG